MTWTTWTVIKVILNTGREVLMIKHWPCENLSLNIFEKGEAKAYCTKCKVTNV